MVMRLVPTSASMRVGDTLEIVGQLTGGSIFTPPTVAKCTPTTPNVATAIRSLTACKVVGLAAGTTEIIAMASTGHLDTATVEVVAR